MSTEVNALLYGDVGSGKTTLSNALGQYSKVTVSGGSSCTRTYYYNAGKYDPFNLVDMPGTAAVEEIQKHIVIQMYLLNETAYNGILIVIPWEDRQDKIVQTVHKHMKLLWRFTDWMSFVITKTEKMKLPDKNDAIGRIRELTMKKDTKVWFMGRISEDAYKVISKEIYNHLSNTRTKEASKDPKLDPTDITMYGDVLTFNKTATVLQNELKDQFFTIDKTLRSHLSQINNDDDLIRSFIMIYKDEANKISEELLEKIGNQMVGFDLYSQYIEFKKLLKNHVVAFEKDARAKFSYRFYQNNSGGKAETYNRFRKCPHCDVIWFKVTACPNTSCGARLESPDIWENGQSTLCGYTFKWVYEKGIKSLVWIKINYSKSKEKKDSYKSQVQAKPVGCGKPICWDDCDDVTDEVLKELKEAQVRDFMATGKDVSNVFDTSFASNYQEEANEVIKKSLHVRPYGTPKNKAKQVKVSNREDILKQGEKLFNKKFVALRDAEENVIDSLATLNDGDHLLLTTEDDEKKIKE